MVQKIEEYCKEQYGMEPEHLWAKYPDYEIFRHPDGKWAVLVLSADARRAGFPGERPGPVWLMVFDCGDEALKYSLMAQDGYGPPRYLKSGSWLSVILDGSMDIGTLKHWVDVSYSEAGKKKK